MFEHLDDPVPFEADAQLRQAVVARGRRHRLVRRMTATVAGLSLLLTTVGAAGALYVARRDAAIDRIDVATEPSLDGAVNVLLVGIDARPTLEGARADTIMVLRVEPDGAVRALSIPRDLVDPATGQRFSTLSESGPQALLDAVTQVTGVPVDHYAEIGFTGLTDLVDELGGIELAIDVPLIDRDSGLVLQPSPCATLDGETTLALLRARHVDGWGDMGRMARNRAVLAAAVAELADVGPDPAELDRLSRILADHATLDAELTTARMVELARTAAAGPDVVETATLPVLEDPANPGTLLLHSATAADVLPRFGATAWASGGPATAETPAFPADIPTPIRPC
jgi:LCP family protein required for cell wall assembly